MLSRFELFSVNGLDLLILVIDGCVAAGVVPWPGVGPTARLGAV